MSHRKSSISRGLLLYSSLLLLALQAAVAQSTPNPNCAIVVPENPLTAKGLATPYQLVATDPSMGACDESNPDQSAFVQAAVLDPATGQISIYNPLVITQGSSPAADPVLPTLPNNAIVALWFGFNGDTLTLQASSRVLQTNGCVNGDRSGPFGQFAYCNAHAFFQAAHRAIRAGMLKVPPLGTAKDGKPCPTSRDFFVVDQDQSDNLPVGFLSTELGLAQKTSANLALFPSATSVANPSDEGLVDKFIDPALGCTPWKATDLADPGSTVPALALNELQASTLQASPVALVPFGDPMVLNNGAASLIKLNAYRIGVDQPLVLRFSEASTANYCRNLVNIAPSRLSANKSFLLAAASPVPADGNNLYTFLAQRFVTSFDMLGCGNLLHQNDPIAVTFDDNGVATDATITVKNPPVCKPYSRRGRHRHW